MNGTELSERDLLIGLSKEIGFIKETLKTLEVQLNEKNESDKLLRDRVIVLEQQCLENTKLRNKVYGTLISTIIQFLVMLLIAGKVLSG